MPQANPQSPPSTGAGGAGGTDPQAKAAEMAGQAQEKAQQGISQVQDRVREQIDQRSSQAAEQINEQASDLRSVGQSLRNEGKDGPAKAADRLAEYAEKVGGYLSEKNADAILSDAEDFGRRQPWAVAAGGVALGVLASRFLKASSGKRYRAHPASQQPAPVLPSTLPGNGYSGSMAPGPVTPGAAPGVL